MEKVSPNENFEEVIKVQKDLINVHSKIEIDDNKPSTSAKKQGTQTKNNSNKKDQDCLYLESMARIIKKLSNDVVYLKKMATKNANQTFNKPSFKRYNPPTSKTHTSTKEAQLGRLINLIKSMNDKPSESQEEQGQKEDKTFEEQQEPEGCLEVAINVVWDIFENSSHKVKEFQAYNTRSKGPVTIGNPSTSRTTSKNVELDSPPSKTNELCG